MPPKRAPTFTAYFVFAETVRASVTEELRAAPGAEGKVGVAQIGKAIGEKWRELSEDEKNKFKEAAAAKTAAARAKLEEDRKNNPEAYAEEDAAGDRAAPAGPSGTDISLPLSLVKKIMLKTIECDGASQRISADALRAVIKATEGFLGVVVSGAKEAADKNKRKTLKYTDLEEGTAKKPRLAFLHEFLRDDVAPRVQAAEDERQREREAAVAAAEEAEAEAALAQAGEGAAEGDGAAADPEGGVPKVPGKKLTAGPGRPPGKKDPRGNVQKITSFFTKKAPVAMVEASEGIDSGIEVD